MTEGVKAAAALTTALVRGVALRGEPRELLTASRRSRGLPVEEEDHA